jgi:hypothetical protein
MKIKTLKENLLKMGYAVSVFDTKEEATAYLKGEIKNTTVGFGGTMTAREMGLGDALSENNEVVWHWFPRDGKTAAEELTNAANTEIYISSVNGIAVSGEIVNIDGTCNRLASTLYGHKKVYFIIGENKIEDTLDGAIYRARNIASPLNAKRLNKNTPCAKNMDENKCYNCSSPERICAALTVFWQRPKGQAYEVVLIRESLGY